VPLLQLRIAAVNQPAQNIPLNQLATIRAQPGATYSVIDPATQKPVSGMLLKKQGDVLVVEVDGQPVAQIEGFYADGQQVVFDTGMQSASGEPLLVTSSTPPAAGSDIVWQAGAGDQAADAGWWSGLTTGEQLGLGAFAVAGIAATAKAVEGGDGSSEVVDTTPPSLVSAAANGNRVVLAYDEALDPTRVPATTAFTVMHGSTPTLVTNVVVDPVGKTITLTTRDTPQPGHAVTVSYADPTPGNDLFATQDLAGNDAATLTAQPVAPDTTPPVLVSAEYYGNTVVMTYNEVLYEGGQPDFNDFLVLIGENGWAPTVVAINSLAGTGIVTLTLPVAASVGELVYITYSNSSSPYEGFYPIQDLAGMVAASITAQPVVPDTTPPLFVSAEVNGNTLVMFYNEALDAASTPDPYSIFPRVAGIDWLATDVVIDSLAGTMTLTLPEPVKARQVVDISYWYGSDNELQDLAGNDAATIVRMPVTNNTPVPPAATDIVVFDLVGGASSDHSGRAFDPDVDYTIYIRVNSDSAELATDGPGPGTWGQWTGAGALGAGDKLILVGSGSPVQLAYNAVVNSYGGSEFRYGWKAELAGYTGSGTPPAMPAFNVDFDKFQRDHSGWIQMVQLFDDTFANLNTWYGVNLASVYLTDMPFGVLTSQGLA
jgi:uncharacterized repeat protein (TIGR02059 family)